MLVSMKIIFFQNVLIFALFSPCLFILVNGLTSLKDFPEECSTANEIDDETRAFDNHNVPTSKADDLQLRKGWYRIMGKFANSLKQGYDRTKKQDLPNFCGTVYAGTLMGQHPTIEEGMVEMTVCFRDRFCLASNVQACECKSRKVIYVRNCKFHYIYWLTPTNTAERYCTGRSQVNAISDTSDALECKKHKTFTSESRLWTTVSDVECDSASDRGGWYRFADAAGGEMASECRTNKKPITRRGQPCGAAFRGWMVDRHPTLQEGRRNTRVCFSYPDACTCEFYSNIAVRNCGTFFVYRINAPALCNARYCGAPPHSTSVVNDAKKPAQVRKKNICDMYHVLYDPSRLWSYTSPTETNCDARLYGYFRFGDMYTPWSIKEGCDKNDMNTVTHRCGTRYQGYLEFRHPTVSEGYVERIVCYQDATVPCECQFNSIIGVQNCSGYYVYELRGVPKCQARMCMVANNSDTITLDRDEHPMYGIPAPGYRAPQADKSTSPVTEDTGALTTTILCIIILVVLILILVVILTVLYIAHPVIWPTKGKDVEEADGDNDLELLVEGYIGHENATEDEAAADKPNYTPIPSEETEEQESDIIKRSDLVPETPPEERITPDAPPSPDDQEPDIQKVPDSEEYTTDEAEKSAESAELEKIEDDIDDIMQDLDATRSDIATLLDNDTPV